MRDRLLDDESLLRNADRQRRAACLMRLPAIAPDEDDVRL
jgi:hypothetical protein